MHNTTSAYCRKCGYRVDKGKSKNCPECGTYFDIKDKSTYSSFPNRPKLRRAVVLCGSGLLLLWVMSYLFMARPDTYQMIVDPSANLNLFDDDLISEYDMDVIYSVPGEPVRVIYAPLNAIDRMVCPKRWKYIIEHDIDALETDDPIDGPTPLRGEETGTGADPNGAN